MKKSFFALFILFAVISCKSKKETATTNPVKEELELTETHPRDSAQLLDIKISESNDMKNMGDSYTILDASIIDNQLWMEVSYGGGCREHQFELLFNNAYLESEDEYGEPKPYVQLTLKHNGNGDACRSIVREKIRFNLKSLQDKGLSQFQIRIKSWEQVLEYKY